MAGLLGSMIAGGVKHVAQGRLDQIEREEKFDLQMALVEAHADKELRLKEAGYQMDRRHAEEERADNKARVEEAFAPVEETSATPESVINKYTDEGGREQVVKAGGEQVTKVREATAKDAVERLVKAGDFELAKGLLPFAQNKDKTFEPQSVTLPDGRQAIFSFDKSSGTGQIVYEGGKKQDVAKSEIELALDAAGGDAKKALDLLVNQKARVAAAGRAPDRPSDADQAYSDWRKKPKNKGKGRDDFERERAGWGKDKDGNLIEVTEETTERDNTGEPVKKTTVKRKEPQPAKPWERQW